MKVSTAILYGEGKGHLILTSESKDETDMMNRFIEVVNTENMTVRRDPDGVWIYDIVWPIRSVVVGEV